jgi:Ca-activated chloride channel family protein
MKHSEEREMRVYKMVPVVGALVSALCGLWHVVLPVVAADRASAVTCSVETDRSVLPANESQKVIAKVTLNSIKLPSASGRSPVNLSIVLDRSGSMGGDKIAKAKEAAIEAVKRLSPKDIFSLVVYDHTIQTVIPAQPVKDVEQISTQIGAIQPGGNTALFGGVTRGAAEIRKHIEDRYVHRIILLSDGLANVGPSARPTSLAAWAQHCLRRASR